MKKTDQRIERQVLATTNLMDKLATQHFQKNLVSIRADIRIAYRQGFMDGMAHLTCLDIKRDDRGEFIGFARNRPVVKPKKKSLTKRK